MADRSATEVDVYDLILEKRAKAGEILMTLTCYNYGVVDLLK